MYFSFGVRVPPFATRPIHIRVAREKEALLQSSEKQINGHVTEVKPESSTFSVAKTVPATKIERAAQCSP
jgi:hypothetical protein